MTMDRSAGPGRAGSGLSARHIGTCLVLLLTAAALAACSYPRRNAELASANPADSYRYNALAENQLEKTLIVVTASGGGTRATALTMATLQGLEGLELASGRNLAEEVDVISSVSGGSVAAGYFALAGTEGFERLERDFIRKDGISVIAWRGLNPVGLIALATPAKERIDLLIDYLDETLFEEKTFAALTARGKRPYLILNAADMVEGRPFAFTRDSFELLCSDLDSLKLSVGVAASAAFPGALSPVTLVNHSPCAAFEDKDLKWPKTWVTNAAKTDWYDNPERVRRGRVAEGYSLGKRVPPPEGKRFIHLLDGGIADNLGVAEPFRMLTTNEVSPNFLNEISKGRIEKVIFILINARSAQVSELNDEIATPGLTAMLGGTINASIDNATFGNFERLESLLQESFKAEAKKFRDPPFNSPELAAGFEQVETFFVPVDFDAIADAKCRRAYQSIATSWALPKKEIDALLLVGPALLKASPKMAEVVGELQLSGFDALPELEAACRAIDIAQRPPPGG